MYILTLKDTCFWLRKSWFQGFKSGINITEQKQMTHQINPLIKILLILACSTTWLPVFLPKIGQSQTQISRIYTFSIFSEIRKNGNPAFEYVKPWVILLHSPKYFGRATTGTCPFGPRKMGTQNQVFAHFGGENFWNSKIFFLQISLFLGPIDDINNIFSPGLPFWLYSDSQFWARILDPNLEMAAVPKRLGLGPKFFRQVDHHTG